MTPEIDTEPLELRKLKRQLANLNCTKYRNSFWKPRYERECNNRDDKEVQAEFYDDFDVSPTFSDKNIGISLFYNDVLCPSCCITMSLLRGSFVKVLKDEESETQARVSNKASWITHKCVEKSTSVTNKPILQISNLTLDDYTSEFSSELTLPKHGRKRSHDRVKFLNITYDKPERDTMKPTYANCSCLESFIESIRPPMVDDVKFR